MNQHISDRRAAHIAAMALFFLASAAGAAPVWSVSVSNGQAFGSAFADANTSVPGSLNATLAFNQLVPGFVDADNILHDFGNSDARQVLREEPNGVDADVAATMTADGQHQPMLRINWSADGTNSASSTANYAVGAEVFSGATIVAAIADADPDLPIVVHYQWSVQSVSESAVERTEGFDDRSLSDISFRARPSQEQVFTTIFHLTSSSQENLGPSTLHQFGSGQITLPPSAEPRSLELLVNGFVMNNLAPPLNAGFDSGSSTFTASITLSLVPPPTCPGDTNGDNAVNGADLSVLLANFGQSVTPGTSGDLNDDAIVNAADLSVLLGTFGINCN